MSALPAPNLPRMEKRAAESHKGTYGHALLIGGSRGMAGAAAIMCRAALRTGAGLVTQAVPESCLQTVAVLNPSAMTLPLPEDGAGRLTIEACDDLTPWFEKASVIACGPGLGRSAALQVLLRHLIEHTRCPLILDADALNNLADMNSSLPTTRAGLIITPHPGEWSRLSGFPAADTDAQRAGAVEAAANASSETVIVLKGHRTLITDGKTAVLNETGTPAMATGGSGDALTGIIAGLLSQGLSLRDAAHLGVHLHGAAGEIAERVQQSHVVLPMELIDHLPQAIAKHREEAAATL
ncbi:MAG: NAD(P)H-hydrate dehydratase [Pirellulales bacterium]